MEGVVREKESANRFAGGVVGTEEEAAVVGKGMSQISLEIDGITKPVAGSVAIVGFELLDLPGLAIRLKSNLQLHLGAEFDPVGFEGDGGMSSSRWIGFKINSTTGSSVYPVIDFEIELFGSELSLVSLPVNRLGGNNSWG